MKNFPKYIFILFTLIFLTTSYLYFMKINEVLFYLKGLDIRLVTEDSVSSSKAYHEIAPLKKYFYFIQLLQSLFLFVYSRRVFKKRIKWFERALDILIILNVIFYLLIGFILMIVPYRMF